MPTLPVADVIFPAFYAPYLWQIFDPIAAIAALTTEFVFYKWWSKATQPARLIIVVLVANVASSVAGVIIATMLPTGYEPRLWPVARVHGQVKLGTTSQRPPGLPRSLSA